MTQTANSAEASRYQMLRRARIILKGLAEMAEHASMTGALRKGAPDAVSAFNRILALTGEQGVELHDLISPLPEDASMDRVGVACKLLQMVLEDELEGEEEHDVRVLVGRAKREEEMGRIQDIGAVLRDHLPDFLKTGEDMAVSEVRRREDEIRRREEERRREAAASRETGE
jgi:hypothetical protein